MRVLILPSWYFPAGTNDIAGRVFLGHAQELRKRGVEAQIAFAHYGPLSPLRERISYTIEHGVPTWRGEGWLLPKVTSGIIQWWINKSGDRILSHIATGNRPDILHAQGYQAGWIAQYLHQKTGIPYIITEHYSGFLEGSIPKRYIPFIKSAFNQARLITAVSPGLKESLATFTNCPIEIIPNDYDPDIFYYDASKNKASHFQWLSIGEPIHTKGLDLLLHAFRKVIDSFPDVHFRLVLADKIPGQPILLRLAKQLGIADKIDFPGLLSPSEVSALMRSSHVLVSASRYETFGKTMLEANACGIPVVASRTAGSDYILKESIQGILCEPGSADALAEGMSKMYRLYQTFNPVEINAAVASRFQTEDIMAKWLLTYSNCIHV